MTNSQLTQFTDEQIRAKAHQIWMARQEDGEPGNPDSDWQAAVDELSAEIITFSKSNTSLNRWYRLGLAAFLSFGAIVVFLVFFQ